MHVGLERAEDVDGIDVRAPLFGLDDRLDEGIHLPLAEQLVEAEVHELEALWLVETGARHVLDDGVHSRLA